MDQLTSDKLLSNGGRGQYNLEGAKLRNDLRKQKTPTPQMFEPRITRMQVPHLNFKAQYNGIDYLPLTITFIVAIHIQNGSNLDNSRKKSSIVKKSLKTDECSRTKTAEKRSYKNFQ